jgi:hypothetical protein
MLLTIAIEAVLLVRTLIFYRHSLAVKLIAAILFFLALFQLAEYNVCVGAFGVDSLTWARIGYASITTLPVLGLHLITVIAKRENPWAVGLAYVAMGIFIPYYLFTDFGLTSSACLGNYVIFEVNPRMNDLYALYYYGLEIAAAYLALTYSASAKTKQIGQALRALVVAYLALLVPTTTVNLLRPETIHGIPSIMCGFAVIFALVLGLYVLPRVAISHHKK